MFTLKQARMLAGYSQERMAELLDVSTVTYYRYEKQPSKMSVLMAAKAERELKCEIDFGTREELEND